MYITHMAGAVPGSNEDKDMSIAKFVEALRTYEAKVIAANPQIEMSDGIKAFIGRSFWGGRSSAETARLIPRLF